MNSRISKRLNIRLRLTFLTTLAVLTVLYVCSFSFKNDITNSSVMVTNIAGNSGGTGIILSSSETHSEILTNSHVCKVVEKGGLITGRAGSFMVASYAHSKVHDLCLVTVEGDLKAHTKVAQTAPTPYYENASISGHPALMPNVITNGHFSGHKVISVMKGITPCTDEQKRDPSTSFICSLIGGIPEITQYEARLVSATIMPGSSGSGVYNDNKELAGVAFAGSGDLGYAWVVPYESMKNFLNQESKTLQPQKPDNNVDVIGGDNQRDTNETTMMEKLKEVCESSNRIKIKDTCRVVGQDMVYFK